MDQYKIAIIDLDGKIERLGDTTLKKEIHAICLLEFAKKNIPMLKSLSN